MASLPFALPKRRETASAGEAVKDFLAEYAPLMAYAASILAALVLAAAGFVALERADRGMGVPAHGGRGFSAAVTVEVLGGKGGAR